MYIFIRLLHILTEYKLYLFPLRYSFVNLYTNIISSLTCLLLKDPNVVRSPRSALNHRKSLVGFHWGDFLVPKRHFLPSNVLARPECCWLDCFLIPLRYQFFLYLRLLPLKIVIHITTFIWIIITCITRDVILFTCV